MLRGFGAEADAKRIGLAGSGGDIAAANPAIQG
jgi:hypothetical protein